MNTHLQQHLSLGLCWWHSSAWSLQQLYPSPAGTAGVWFESLPALLGSPPSPDKLWPQGIHWSMINFSVMAHPCLVVTILLSLFQYLPFLPWAGRAFSVQCTGDSWDLIVVRLTPVNGVGHNFEMPFKIIFEPTWTLWSTFNFWSRTSSLISSCFLGIERYIKSVILGYNKMHFSISSISCSLIFFSVLIPPYVEMSVQLKFRCVCVYIKAYQHDSEGVHLSCELLHCLLHAFLHVTYLLLQSINLSNEHLASWRYIWCGENEHELF